jgi:hypothetical protein
MKDNVKWAIESSPGLILTDSDTGTEAKFNGLTLGEATSLAASDEASCTMGSHVSPRD